MKIGTATELVTKGEEPSARQRRKVLPRKVLVGARPHKMFALACRPPGTKRLATDEWAKHLTLDPTATFA